MVHCFICTYVNLIYKLLIYDFSGTVYLQRILKNILSYYFIDLCHILNGPTRDRIFLLI